MVDTTIYRWANGSLAVEEWCDTNPGAVRVADSFLVVDGGVVEVERHRARFAGGMLAQGIDADIDRFVRSTLAEIPRTGRWFPRIEAIDYGDGALLRLILRPAPEPRETVTLATAAVDPRTAPTIKGPDLATLGNLRRDSGADEAIITTEGLIAEGAWSSIVWWKDDRLNRVNSAIPRLPSVTESVLVDHARHIGAPIADGRVTPAELDGAEVWVLSALHGIRVATEWIDGPALHVEPGRVEYWRQQYVNRRTAL
jgi:branched-subunit amino acid aminotransferase/4-amino-4-deoxychorismate lyase